MGVKITFDLRAGKISIEGSDKEVLKLLQEAKSIAPHIEHINIGPAGSVSDSGSGTGSGSDDQKPAIREFARSLPVSTHYERIAALAYYAVKKEGRSTVSPKEMEDWFDLCGFKRPGNMRVALADAKHKYHYVDNKGRGQWTISTGGQNLIIGMTEKHP